MSTKSLGNPFDGKIKLTHSSDCRCETCTAELNAPQGMSDKQRLQAWEREAEQTEQAHHQHAHESAPESFETSEDMMDRVVESAIVRGVFGHHDASRRNFLRLMGGGTLAAALGTMISSERARPGPSARAMRF